MTATPAVTTDDEWDRYDDCRACGAPARKPCFNKFVARLTPGTVVERVRPHSSRMLRCTRDTDGRLLGGHQVIEQRTPVLHVMLDDTAPCNGQPINPATVRPILEVVWTARCQRPACKRHWRVEDDDA